MIPRAVVTEWRDDIGPLLPTGAEFDHAAADALVRARLVEALPGDPWKGSDS